MKVAWWILVLGALNILPLFLFGQNVGIGTTSPNISRLEIVGGNSQLVSRGIEAGPGIALSAPLGLSAAISFNMYYANAYRIMSSGYGANIQYSPSSGILSFSTSQTKGSPGDIVFFNSNTVSVDSNGNLGIGTTAPKARLHVNNNMVIGATALTPAVGYLLSVDGKVICEELKVQSSAAWPDYVFEQDYPLPALDELKRQVMHQKHLPGMLPADVIATQKGYLVGDMQKRLLEKVEELYRYLFIMDEENKQLKATIEDLRIMVLNQKDK
jgi:hypothetical protein